MKMREANQRLTVLAMVAALGCSKHGMSPEERRLLEDVRMVERSCLAQFATLKHEREIRQSADEIGHRLDERVRKPWQALRARIAAAPPFSDGELDTTLRRYLAERESAWSEFEAGACCFNDEGKHFAAYREQDELAAADAKHLAELLAGIDLAALPPLAVDAGVVLQAPPPAPPGAMFLLVGGQVVRLDDAGFRVIATEVSTMDVLPDGTMWACGTWNTVYWDGARATAYQPKVALGTCAAGPDGKLWATHHDYDTTRNSLVSFDRSTWSSTLLDTYDTEGGQLLVDRDRTLYIRGLPHGLNRIAGHTSQPVALGGPEGSPSIEHMFRGGDGHVWIFYQVTHGKDYPYALAQLTPTGSLAPVFIDDHFQTSFLYATVDASGLATILDLRRDVIEQGGKTLRLPLPAVNDRHERNGPGPFAFDAGGRIWIDLVDGLNAIDRTGTRVVFPRGSIDAVRDRIVQIAVIGAGPKLPVPGPVPTRTISGTVVQSNQPVPNVPVMMCGETSSDPPCAEALPRWTATTDANGRFTFANVPRWKYEVQAEVGARNHRVWRALMVKCCADDATELPPAEVAAPLRY